MQNMELLGRNPWRHNFSKLATFDPIFQLPDSALMIMTSRLASVLRV